VTALTGVLIQLGSIAVSSPKAEEDEHRGPHATRFTQPSMEVRRISSELRPEKMLQTRHS
jgi:hypothetical protein